MRIPSFILGFKGLTYSVDPLFTYPTKPILSPLTLRTLDVTIRGGVLDNNGSCVKLRFEATTGKFRWLMKDTKFSTPSSNS